MIRRQNSLPDILQLQQEKKIVQIKKQQSIPIPDQEPQPVFKYVLHEHQERIQLAKMFYKNMKKRQIARNLNQIKSQATLNGVALKSGQLFKQRLYVEQNQLQENPQIYLCPQKKIVEQKTQSVLFPQRSSPVQRNRAFTTKSSFHLKSVDMTKNDSMISQKKQDKILRTVDEVKGTTKLFTIVYKTLKYQN